MLYFSLVSVGVQKVGPCTHLHTHSTKTEDMLRTCLLYREVYSLDSLDLRAHNT